MKRPIIAALLLAVIPAPAAATDVATFVAKIEAAKHNKFKALFSGEASRLMDELGAAMQQVKAERLRAEASGGHGAYCPPPGARLTGDEQFKALTSIPPADRPRLQVRDAFRMALARKYPCPLRRSGAR